MEVKIVRIVIDIAALCVIGFYLLINKDNIFSRALSRDVYKPEKVSTFFAYGCFGIAFSCTPSLLSILFQKLWLNIFSVLFLLIVIVSSSVYERKGNLK